MTEYDDALGIMRKLRPGTRCVVSHPDAGGQCEEPAALTVWGLPFCLVHGAEAETSALTEAIEDVEMELDVLVDAEKARPLTNWALVHTLQQADVPRTERVEHELNHTEAIRAAYPPIESRLDADTLRYDYGDPTSDEPGDHDSPHDWWNEAHWIMTKAMRMARERGLAGLLKDLEYVRERAAAQVVQAEADLERRWAAPRRAAREAARG